MGVGSSAVAVARPKVKGLALEHFFEWYRRTEGVERLVVVLDGLPTEHRAVLGSDPRNLGVLASAWYDAGLVHAVIDAMSVGKDEAARTKLAEAGAEAIVRTNLRGIYKVLFQLFTTPERYATRAQALWERYYDSGRIEKTVDSKTQHTSNIHDWAGHHPILCEMNLVSARIIYEELGCKNVRTRRTRCVSRGDAYCTQIVTWDA